MAGRARCWVCGDLLAHGARGVCPTCIAGLEGFCVDCPFAESCEQMYRAALEDRRRRGLPSPSYPPCLRRPAAYQPRPQLERTQQRTYGASFVGVVTLLLASMDTTAEEERRRQTQLEADVVELARVWGARLRRCA